METDVSFHHPHWPLRPWKKRFQDPKNNFREAAADLDCLRKYLVDSHDKICQELLAVGKKRCQAWGLKIEKRKVRRTRYHGEHCTEAGLTPEQEICRIMKAALDRLISEIDARFFRLYDLDSRFGFLLDIHTTILGNPEDINLGEKCSNLAKNYPGDIEGAELFREIEDCRMLLKKRILTDFPILKIATDLLKFIVSGEDVFPNLRIALRILLTIGVSVASCERSYSKLKLILIYLRTSMAQQRLSDLAILSLEKNVLENVDFDESIDVFASARAREVGI